MYLRALMTYDIVWLEIRARLTTSTISAKQWAWACLLLLLPRTWFDVYATWWRPVMLLTSNVNCFPLFTHDFYSNVPDGLLCDWISPRWYRPSIPVPVVLLLHSSLQSDIPWLIVLIMKYPYKYCPCFPISYEGYLYFQKNSWNAIPQVILTLARCRLWVAFHFSTLVQIVLHSRLCQAALEPTPPPDQRVWCKQTRPMAWRIQSCRNITWRLCAMATVSIANTSA